MQREMLVGFLGFFLLANGLGLIIANAFLPPEINAQITQSVTIINDDKADPINAVGLVAYILIVTGILLLVIKFFSGQLGILFRIFEGFAIFFVAAGVIEILLTPFLTISGTVFFAAIAGALGIVILRNILPENVPLRNLVTILLTAYIGALIGTGLGVIPVALLVALLVVYDFIAVFKTKHMVTLAKAVTKKNLSFTYAIPTKEHQFELGTGDIAIPLAFAASVMQDYSLHWAYPTYALPALAMLVASLIGLMITLEYSSKNIGKALPALPLQGILMLITFGLLKLFLPV